MAFGGTPAVIRPITVTCDRCGGRFEAVLKERPLRGGGAERRFRCPWCNKWYIVCTITPLGVKIFQQIKGVEAQMRKRVPSGRGDEGLQEQLARLRELLKPEVSGPNE